MTSKIIEVTYGDILNQNVDVIVNPWNMNFIPWWLLWPQGVSKAIKQKGGYQPFIEVSKYGLINVGEAIITNAGKLNYKGIIHVAGLNMFWISTEKSIRKSVYSAINIVNQKKFSSIAFPLIGAGTGGKKINVSKDIILDVFNKADTSAKLVLVIYQPN